MQKLVALFAVMFVIGCTAVSEPEDPAMTPVLTRGDALARVGTVTSTAVVTETAVPHDTATTTHTPLATSTYTATPTHTPTTLPTETATSTSTATPTMIVIPTETATPTATASQINCPTASPEPLWVEPVISPTNLLTQTIVVYAGNSERVEVDTGYDLFTETGSFGGSGNPASIEIELQPGETHTLSVRAWVREIQRGDCVYGGYRLSTRHDRHGNPLEIKQESE